ncbi:hypothetical protein MMC14_009905 [Varicellaria rhodocarpa]|nr:hypothetical protein [Varicellaria rhodocarpa]
MSQEVRIVTTTTRLYSLLIVLGFSIILNAILILRSTNVTYTVDLLRSLKAILDTSQGSSPALERTKYAGLTRDLEIPWTWHGPFYPDRENETEQVFQLWEKADTGPGAIALPDDFKLLARSLSEFHKGHAQTEPFEHNLHCLDALRQDVMCAADDTPRYTGYKEKVSGVGQYRQCRDWSRLEAWARQYNACHRHLHLEDGESVLERYKFCPEGSPYLKKVREAFGDVPAWTG